MCFLARGALDWSDRGLGEQSSGVHAKTGDSVPSFTDLYRRLSWLQRLTRVPPSPSWKGPLPVAYIPVRVFTTLSIFCVLQEISKVPLCVLTPESPPLRETPSGLKNNLKTFFVYSRHQSLVSYGGGVSVEWAICLPCLWHPSRSRNP